MEATSMTYKDARKTIQDGDIVFVRNKNTVSAKVVRVFTRSLYSHVGFAFWIEAAGKRRLMMVEAQGGAKRRIVNMSYYRENELDIIQAKEDWNIIGDQALSQLGLVSYGWGEAAYVGLRETLLKVFNVQIPRKDFPGEICSEYVARILKLKKQHISPQLLCEELLGMGYKERVQIR